MACNSCVSDTPIITVDPRWRRALWVALVVNASMFAVELYAGSAADSHALKADALDFFGDAANYAISLLVAGMALAWRARASLLKGLMLTLLGAYVFASASWAAWHGSSPQPETMGSIGFLALIANVAVALMLFRFRSGDPTCGPCGSARAMMRSATWLSWPPQPAFSEREQPGRTLSWPVSWPF